MRKAVSFVFLLLLAAPAAAQTPAEPTPYDRALAAGYKAQFLCWGLWNGGRTAAQVEADEFDGIYERIQPVIGGLTAEVDEAAHQVRVGFDPAMPPRVAQWRPGLGCVSLPIGAAAASAATLPALPGAAGLASLDDRPWPMGDRTDGDPQTRQPTAVDRLVAETVSAARFGGRTSAVLVVDHGRIVSEMYKPGHDLHTTQRTWSVAKSLAGTLIGHAVQRGLLRPEEPAHLAAWRAPGDPRAAITIEQLMRMSSGLTSDTAGNRTDDIYMGGTAVGDRAPRWPLLHPPGTSFRYANNDILLATMALTERLPSPVRLGFPLEFFRRIGMTRTVAETDWQGDFILSSQVWTSARDLARLGLLYQNDGVWEGERLLPEGWRAFVTRPSGPQPEGEFGYGATFWLMNHSEGVPADAFAAFGNRGQYLVIIPSRELVIVRRGYDTADERFDVAAFTREVVAALD